MREKKKLHIYLFEKEVTKFNSLFLYFKNNFKTLKKPRRGKTLCKKFVKFAAILFENCCESK